VVNRSFIDELRKGLKSRWAAMSGAHLVAVLSAMRQMADCDRIAALGRSGIAGGGHAAGRLLTAAEEAEGAVLAALAAARGDGAAGAAATTRTPSQQAAGKERAQAQQRGARRAGPTAAPSVPEEDRAKAGSPGLPPGGALALARAYMSFYLSAAAGTREFGLAPRLLCTALEAAQVAASELEAASAEAAAAGGGSGSLAAAGEPEGTADALARLVVALVTAAPIATADVTQPLARCVAGGGIWALGGMREWLWCFDI
jgi:hypothetical protein